MNMRSPIRFICIALLGLATAALVSCSAGSSKNLIPIQNAGPLQSDFEEVARDAREGNGNCTATEAALSKTEQDFVGLPSTVDHGLRTRLKEGISNLRARSLALCAQPLAQSTSTESSTDTTSTQSPTTTTNTETQPSTTPTQTTPTDTGPSTTTTPPSPEGGTPAPGTPGNAPAGVTPGNEQSGGSGNGAGGTGAGNSDGQGGGQ